MNKISLSKYMFFQYVCAGVCWIVAGVAGYFDNLLCSLISAVAFFLAFLTTVYSNKKSKEKSDERSEENENTARAITQQLATFILLIVLLLDMIVPEQWYALITDWPNFVYQSLMIFLGVQELMIGSIFIWLER